MEKCKDFNVNVNGTIQWTKHCALNGYQYFKCVTMYVTCFSPLNYFLTGCKLHRSLFTKLNSQFFIRTRFLSIRMCWLWNVQTFAMCVSNMCWRWNFQALYEVFLTVCSAVKTCCPLWSLMFWNYIQCPTSGGHVLFLGRANIHPSPLRHYYCNSWWTYVSRGYRKFAYLH